MAERRDRDRAPETFRSAVSALRSAAVRPEVLLEEAPAPQRLAPWAVALTADVVVDGGELASGRIVLLHDPLGHETWEGTFRLVSFVRAELEPEMAADPLLPGVGWAWLVEALAGRGVAPVAASGTVTRVASESFGVMNGQPASAQVEIRASWTPRGPEMGAHVEGWCDLLCTVAGLPPLPPGVLVLPSRRSGRG